MEKSSGKTIARNTIFLYFRMLCIMFVTLYSSRVILYSLGVEDYGYYQTIGGIVIMLSFLNSALSTGSSRFLTFELGKGTTEKLKKTFSTLLFAHIIIAILMLIIGEPLGLWFLRNHIVIPMEKMKAAYIVFHLSIITSIINITQVPYTSVIIAHENLSIYAYVSIIEVILKLGVAFVVKFIPDYRLEFYALLIAIVQFLIIIFYRVFCVIHYEESRFSKKLLDFHILRNVGIFSGWSLFAAIAGPLTNQGTIILLNNFFSPVIVTARSLSQQVNNAANQFISNFRTASNPQIVKRFSVGDYEGSKSLLLKSTLFSYYLMLIIALPLYLLAEPLLQIWLIEVPVYTLFYLRFAMISSLFSVFDVSFYTALYAKGRLKENALLSPVLSALQFPLLYLLFKKGMSPAIVAYTNLGVNILLGVIVKPILIIHICKYKFMDIFLVFKNCLFVTLFAIPIPFISSLYINKNSIIGFLLIGSVSVFATCLSIFIIGLNKEMKKTIYEVIKQKFFIKKRKE